MDGGNGHFEVSAREGFNVLLRDEFIPSSIWTSRVYSFNGRPDWEVEFEFFLITTSFLWKLRAYKNWHDVTLRE